MSSPKTLYKLLEINSNYLEIPEAYQRRLNTDRVARIVSRFDERIAKEGRVSRNIVQKAGEQKTINPCAPTIDSGKNETFKRIDNDIIVMVVVIGPLPFKIVACLNGSDKREDRQDGEYALQTRKHRYRDGCGLLHTH